MPARTLGGGDRVAAELNERAYQAARRHVGPEGSRERGEAFERACAAAIEVQNMALAAAIAELEQARSERRYNPADVDAVLAELDAMVFVAERDALAPPRRLR